MLRAIVLLSIPAALLACTPTAPVNKMFLVQGVKELPVEFAYSTRTFPSYPYLARTRQEALKTIRTYVRQSVRRVIRKVVQEAGYPQADQQAVAQQVTPKLYEYEPLNCLEAIDITAITATTPITVDNTCLMIENAIQGVGFRPNQKLPIAPNHRLFFVDLEIQNLQISQLNRDQWKQLLARVKTELENGIYGIYFRSVAINFLG
ncbi:hypothetical protein Aduo_004323 [Ancylostoma duodenale]